VVDGQKKSKCSAPPCLSKTSLPQPYAATQAMYLNRMQDCGQVKGGNGCSLQRQVELLLGLFLPWRGEGVVAAGVVRQRSTPYLNPSSVRTKGMGRRIRGRGAGKRSSSCTDFDPRRVNWKPWTGCELFTLISKREISWETESVKGTAALDFWPQVFLFCISNPYLPVIHTVILYFPNSAPIYRRYPSSEVISSRLHDVPTGYEWLFAQKLLFIDCALVWKTDLYNCL
jgi:hypothetical protein